MSQENTSAPGSQKQSVRLVRTPTSASGQVPQTSRPRQLRLVPTVVRPPCIHEGPVLEFCKTCRGNKGELKHVRDCDIYEKCTRGIVSAAVKSCAQCEQYKAEGASETQPEVIAPTKTFAVIPLTIPQNAGRVRLVTREELPNITAAPLPRSESEVAVPIEKRKTVTWACAVTTVLERRDTLLPKTLQSLANAGFPRPHLFVDGDDDVHEWRKRTGLEVSCRYPRIRTFGNWVLAAAELYIRFPRQTYYVIFQDDFVTYKNLRQYLEKIQYPDRGYLNLYTFPKNQVRLPDRVGFYPSNQKGLGAVALVFNEPALINLLTHQHMVLRPRDMLRGHKAVDGGIVTALNKAGYSEYVHNPSLVQHTGLRSSMGNREHAQATSFRGEHYDALQLLEAATQPSTTASS